MFGLLDWQGIAQQAKKQPELTESQLMKACKDLERSINDTTKESKRSTVRIKELEKERDECTASIQAIGDEMNALKVAEEGVKMRMSELSKDKMRLVVEKSSVQHMIRRMEEFTSGKRSIHSSRDTIEGALSDFLKSRERNKAVADIVKNVFAEHASLEQENVRAVALLQLIT